MLEGNPIIDLLNGFLFSRTIQAIRKHTQIFLELIKSIVQVNSINRDYIDIYKSKAEIILIMFAQGNDPDLIDLFIDHILRICLC